MRTWIGGRRECCWDRRKMGGGGGGPGGGGREKFLAVAPSQMLSGVFAVSCHASVTHIDLPTYRNSLCIAHCT